jgi:undecaprenyl-diphosphatase
VVIGLPTKPEARRFALSVIIGCIPAFAAGLALHGVIKHFFREPAAPGDLLSLIIGGVILLVIDKKAPPAARTTAWRCR